MKHQKRIFISFILFCLIVAGSAIAEPPPVQEPSSEADIKAALSGGVPMER